MKRERTFGSVNWGSRDAEAWRRCAAMMKNGMTESEAVLTLECEIPQYMSMGTGLSLTPRNGFYFVRDQFGKEIFKSRSFEAADAFYDGYNFH